jgi:hypothetical protein
LVQREACDLLIPSNLSFDLLYPGIGAQEFYPSNFRNEAVPSFAGGAGGGVTIAGQPMRQERPVNSNAAGKLTAGAFPAMKRDAKIGRGEAMRRSITALIRHGEAWEARPPYWAPFAVASEGGR